MLFQIDRKENYSQCL